MTFRKNHRRIPLTVADAPPEEEIFSLLLEAAEAPSLETVADPILAAEAADNLGVEEAPETSPEPGFAEVDATSVGPRLLRELPKFQTPPLYPSKLESLKKVRPQVNSKKESLIPPGDEAQEVDHQPVSCILIAYLSLT